MAKAGFSGEDTVIGGAGNDIFVGGLGNDRLDGGAGLDVYQFNSALGAGNVDQIIGYSSLDDTIQIDDAVFTGGGLTLGALGASAFVVGAAATTAAHRIAYNFATGHLSYDADGSGAGTAILFATIDSGLVLTSADFLVV